MEEKLREHIGFLRAKFNKQGLDIDKLINILKRDQLLPPEHVAGIERQTTSASKLDRLLDEIVGAKDSTYKKLLMVVEQCVPPTDRTVPPVSSSFHHRNTAPGSESCSTSQTSDSEEDVIRSQRTSLRGAHSELPSGRGKLTNILTSRHYDDSTSSSFPALNECYSPLTVSDERHSERQSPLEAIRKQISLDNRFDWLQIKMQFDGALGELETLKQQNAEKMEQLSQEAEYFRNMYKKSEATNAKTQEELHNIKTLNVKLLATKQQLQEDLEQIKKLREEDQHEMSELRLQHDKAITAMSGPGTSDVLTDLYHASLEKYDVLHKDYDMLRERYADLAAQHSSACCQLDDMVDLRKQVDEVKRERDETERDKVAFQQQCTAIIQNLQKVMSDNSRLKRALEDLQREHDSCSKDQRQFQAKVAHLQKECGQAIAARQAAEMEHRRTMEEREVVHAEIQQLQDKLSEMSKLTEKYSKDKSAAEKETERLKQDLSASAVARDKYRQESQGALEMHAQLEAERRKLQREFQQVEQQRDIACKERHQALERMDVMVKETYEKTQKEKAEEMGQAAKEAEVLKKQIDKIKHELTDAEKEAMLATMRRDWAFSEIDKTMQERESIRILCDNLRRDRDRAVSELAKALRSSDECEKQKNDAVKELKEIRDKYEAMVERDTRRQQLNSVGHNHSRDSAIDADLQEWETETLEIELDGGDSLDLGFDLVGGKGNPQFPGDSALFISHVTKGGAAEGKLRVNDLLLKVNNFDTANTERRHAEQALRKHSRALILVVRRRKSSAARTWHPLQLFISCQKEGSIQLEQGLFVSGLQPGRLIGKDGMLPSFGDRIISINHQSTDTLTVQEASELLEKGSQPVVLDVLRQTSPLSSTGSSPTPTSVSALSPMTENISPAQSKSDTLATQNALWDSTSGDSARSGGDSSKNLRSSGSQTDSLDSPGPSPPKSLRNHVRDHENKVRHSMPVLDKAREIVVDKIFRSRHKSQDRDHEEERHHSRIDGHETGRNKDKDRRQGSSEQEDVQEVHRPVAVMVSSNTQTPLKGADNVAGEFPASAFSRTSPYADSKSRKREYEADSNSGTWPKSRTGLVISSTVPSTVTLAPAKERPSIKDPCVFQPPQQQRQNSSESGDRFSVDHSSVCHSQQSSDSSGAKYPVNVATVQPLVPSSKSPPHFSVGVMQPPSIGVVHPAFPKQRTGHSMAGHHQTPQYSKVSNANPVHSYPHPHSRHYPPPVQTGSQSHPVPSRPGPKPSYPDVYSATLHPQRVTPKTGGKYPRPTSAPHRGHHGDRQWPPVPSWAIGPPPPPPHIHHMPSNSRSPDATSPTRRPVSLEVPHSLRFGDVPGKGTRVASPVGASLGSGLPSQSSHPSKYLPVSSSGSQHSSRPLVMNQRYSSPPGMFKAISPELEGERAPFHSMLPLQSLSDYHSSPSPSQQSFTGLDHMTPTPSEEFDPPPYVRPSAHGGHGYPLSDTDLRHPVTGGYTRHDKHLERIRIPPSNSVATKSSSVEIVSDRSSPVSSIFRFDRNGSHKGKHLSVSSDRDEYLFSPRHHETRTITFEKSSEPVGFQIQRGPAGGIFVSTVNDNSLAAQAGLVIGDQLLEVCGINMRNATYEHAVTVLRQCGNNLIMKVQYNPEKYMDNVDSASTISVMSSVATSPTHSKRSPVDSGQSTPKHHTPQRSNSSGDGTYERPHVVQFKRHKGDIGPGFTIVGGNAVGIFVHEIESASAATSDLQRGDMIVEYNNISFQAITAEQAILELNKPCSLMRLTVLNSFSKYSKIQNIPGDCFFIRTNFSRAAEGEGELDFRRDDILVVENTVHRGTLNLWLAWLVDEHGNKIRCGSIPSRLRLEDEVVLKRSHSESWSLGEAEELKGSRRGSGSARRSFFRRRRHQRNSSKDSREGSFSDASINSESVPILDESVMGYTQVERIECEQTRPVVLLAPLAEPIIRKLESESPDKYKFCEPCTVLAQMKDMEQSLAEGRLLDYWKKDDLFECVEVSHIQNMCEEKIHGLLNVNPRAIERLHRQKIYPIVIFVRHKNHKQIKEIRDPQFLAERLSNKVAKDSYDHFSKMEQDCSHLFSSVVQGGNLAEMSTHIKTAINTEQKKAIWVTKSTL